MENVREKTKGGDVKDGKRMGRNRKKWRKNLNCSHKTERSIFKIYIYIYICDMPTLKKFQGSKKLINSTLVIWTYWGI